MSTSKPRITVTFEPRVYQALQALSEASDQPMSKIVAGIVEASTATLERMAVSFGQLKHLQRSEVQRLTDALDDASSALEPVVHAALNQMDLFSGKLGAAGAASARSAASARTHGAAVSAKSPPTNRGVTPKAGKSGKGTPDKAGRGVVSEKVFKKTPAKKRG